MRDKFKDYNFHDIKAAGIEAFSEEIPCIGPFFATIHNAREIQYKRQLEEIINHLKNQIEGLEDRIKYIPDADKIALAYLTEKVLDNYSTEIFGNKRESYKNYLSSIFSTSLENKFEINESSLLLSILDRISYLDIDVLRIIAVNVQVQTEVIQIEDVNQSYIIAAVNNLKSIGLIKNEEHLLTGFNEELGHFDNSIFKLSNVGKKFIDYCFD